MGCCYSTRIGVDNQQIHPLQNYLVYKRMFKHVPKSSWKSCRLVCRAWNEELLQSFREQTIVHIKNSSRSSHPLASSRRSQPIRAVRPGALDCVEFLAANLTEAYQFGKHPFRHVSAEDFTFLNVASIPFWILCGPWLHSLHLHCVKITCSKSFRRLVHEWTPNLETFQYTNCRLKLKQYDVDNTKGFIMYRNERPIIQRSLTSLTVFTNCGFPMTWMDFLFPFHNLETINLPELGLSKWLDLRYILEAFEAMRTEFGNEVMKIKQLDVLQTESDGSGLWGDLSDTLDYLSTVSLPLETLKLSGDGHVTVELMRRVFDAFQSTLTHFGLKYYPISTIDLVSSYLPNQLTHLELIGPVFVTWRFLQFIPNLVELVVDRMEDEEVITPVEEIHPIYSLETFEYKTRFSVSLKHLPFLGRVMPSVKSLSINVNCAGFRLLCHQWPELEELKPFGLSVDERFFVENLVSLTRLKSVCFHYGPASQIFGQLSITHGYLKLPLLRHLVSDFSEKTKKKILKQLLSKLDDASRVKSVSHEQSQRAFQDERWQARCRTRFETYLIGPLKMGQSEEDRLVRSFYRMRSAVEILESPDDDL